MNPTPCVRLRRTLSCALLFLALLARPAFAILPDLSAGGTPAGWSAPAVPRNTGDATEGAALLPSQLATTAPTFFNWSVSANQGVTGTWRDEFYLDGQLIQLVTRSNLVPGAQWWLEVNSGPVIVEGGRHALTISADAGNQTGESVGARGNNVWTGQFLWQPLPLASASSRTTSPPEGALAAPGPPNCSAFAFTRAPGTAWVVALGSSLAATPFELALYDDYVNSTTGLTSELARSSRGGTLTDFVVGSASGAAATLYPAVLRGPGTAPAGVAIAAADASDQQTANGVGSWPSVNLPAGQSAHVYEATLTTGAAESAVLTRFLGNSDLEITVFAPGTLAAGRAQAPWTGTPRAGAEEYDDLGFTPPTTGTYLFVISRVDGQDINEAAGYTFELAAGGTIGVPPAALVAPLTALPSPARGPMRLGFALARAEDVRLEIYDLAGRAVRRLEAGALPAGPHARTWDGRDDRGAAVAPGRYWARLIAGARHESLGVLRLR